MAINPIGLRLQAYRQDLTARIDDRSAEHATIRDAVGRILQTCLGPEGLTAAFGHAPGAIGAMPPFALSLWETGTSVTQTFNPDAEGHEEEQEITLALIVAVAPLGPDLVRLQALAENWELPLWLLVDENSTLDGTVIEARHVSFALETLPWGDSTYYCAVERVRCTLVR